MALSHQVREQSPWKQLPLWVPRQAEPPALRFQLPGKARVGLGMGIVQRRGEAEGESGSHRLLGEVRVVVDMGEGVQVELPRPKS